MEKLTKVVLLLSIINVESVKHPLSRPVQVFCRLSNNTWEENEGRIFSPTFINPRHCTHIIYGDAQIFNNSLREYPKNHRDERLILRKLKDQNSELKLILSLIEPLNYRVFADVASNETSTLHFAAEAVRYLRDFQYDGLLVVWEYPEKNQHERIYTNFFKSLRQTFENETKLFADQPRLILCSQWLAMATFEAIGVVNIPEISKYIDYLVITDSLGPWNLFHLPPALQDLRESDVAVQKYFNLDFNARELVRAGMPKEKLVFTTMSYGEYYRLVGPDRFCYCYYFATVTDTKLDQSRICDFLDMPATKTHWDCKYQRPYAIKDKLWLTYADEKSVKLHANWTIRNGYGGISLMSLENDDFSGHCGKGRFPLLSAIYNEVQGHTIPLEYKGPYDNPIKAKTSVSTIPDPIIFCYIKSWSSYRKGIAKFSPRRIDSSLCTHLVYAFAFFDDKNNHSGGGYDELLAIRDSNPHLPLLLAVGGRKFGNQPFRELFQLNNLSQSAAPKFIQETVKFLRKLKIDGLDFDWQYPSDEFEKFHFARMLKNLRIAFENEAHASEKPRLLLTTAVSGSYDSIFRGYDIPEISKYVDFINVMTFDMSTRNDTVQHISPLFSDNFTSAAEKKLNVDFMAWEWVMQGAFKEKILVGLPLYGKSYTLADFSEHNIGAGILEPGNPGPFLGKRGELSHFEICKILHDTATNLKWDTTQQVPYAYKGNQWITFENERSLRKKVQWLKNNGFGGIGVWTIDMDDFSGSCGNGKFPLLTAINHELKLDI